MDRTSPGRTARIWTAGHSDRPLEALLELLAGPEIELLADVRRYPGSRRHPQFGEERLAPALAAAGIAYRHLPGLGGRRRARPDSPNTAWRNEGFRAYADHMASEEFRAALAELEAAARERRTAVLCAEAVPWRCHRRLIADALVARGWEVAHLLASGRDEVHTLHPDALVQDDRLTYPAAAPQQIGLFR